MNNLIVCKPYIGIGVSVISSTKMLKNCTVSDRCASYLDILLIIDFMTDWQLHYMINVMTLTLQLSIFLFSCSNVPLSPAYGVYVSQLIRYARACHAYADFLKRGQLLTKKLMMQGYNESRLKSSFRKFYGRYNDLVCDYKWSN